MEKKTIVNRYLAGSVAEVYRLGLIDQLPRDFLVYAWKVAFLFRSFMNLLPMAVSVRDDLHATVLNVTVVDGNPGGMC